MTPTALIRIMRVDDLKNFTFVDNPDLWIHWEIENCPLLAHEDKYCTLEDVTNDIEKAKNILNKALGKDALFIPRYVATAFITLLRRLVPFEPSWVPAFELRDKKTFPGCFCNILKLDEREEKWTLIHWEVGQENNFTSIDFQVSQDERTAPYGEISMTSLYTIIDQQIYQKMDLLYCCLFAGMDYPEIFKGY
jgi:hypothetical protein